MHTDIMDKDRSDILYATANELLAAAEHEDERSAEDVVTHLICTNSRLSLSNFLAGYLIRRQIPVHHPVTLARLLEQCRSLDARFDSIDLTPIHCRHEAHDKDYCLETTQVDACLRIAQQARDIVMTDTPAY
ncbi:MAG: hypothetical protein IPN60_08585 [Saprospiraceae bacterium]|nr:hypothetical protein [Candidatus Opimibacter skivensis]